ncbi:cytochrome P450 family protein [Ceratobasidium sp. AG-Ba]|nr:cytochrome P450 family protein [Ceratobasidium sp. AG-Ba]
MALSITDYAVCVGIFVAAYSWMQRKSSKLELPLPPGPPRWPFIGSLLSLPRAEPNWKVFLRWGKENGSDIVYVPIAGDNLIILNSHEAAVELLERRSASYSDRPRLMMAGELVGWNQTLGLTRYGNKVRRTRRLLHDAMSLKAMQAWQPLQEQEAQKFIQRLLHTPQDLVAHIRQTAGASVVKLTYGYTVSDNSNEYLKIAERAMDSFSVLTTPGAFMVDFFPWLQYVPWAPFKKTVTQARKHLLDMVDVPMAYVREQMNHGQGVHSLMSKWLETPSGEKDHEEIVKWAAGSLYAAGADTTVSAICTFFVAMVYNPSVQRKAQAEISQVLHDRLPTLADRGQLPYVEAIYKEVLRWQALAPLGLPHAYMGEKDDEYKGMRIPTGSIIMPNVWAMLRDPLKYDGPDQFKPERFLGPRPEPNSEDIAFGFGRRRCPGIHVAQSSVWLSIALTLAAYDIAPAVNKEGNEVLPSLDYSNQTVRRVFREQFQST